MKRGDKFSTRAASFEVWCCYWPTRGFQLDENFTEYSCARDWVRTRKSKFPRNRYRIIRVDETRTVV